MPLGRTHPGQRCLCCSGARLRPRPRSVAERRLPEWRVSGRLGRARPAGGSSRAEDIGLQGAFHPLPGRRGSEDHGAARTRPIGRRDLLTRSRKDTSHKEEYGVLHQPAHRETGRFPALRVGAGLPTVSITRPTLLSSRGVNVLRMVERHSVVVARLGYRRPQGRAYRRDRIGALPRPVVRQRRNRPVGESPVPAHRGRP